MDFNSEEALNKAVAGTSLVQAVSRAAEYEKSQGIGLFAANHIDNQKDAHINSAPKPSSPSQ